MDRLSGASHSEQTLGALLRELWDLDIMLIPMNPLILDVLLQYVRLVRKRPVVMTVVSILVIGGATFGLYWTESRLQAAEKLRQESLTTYSHQLQRLDDVQQALKDLSDFVSQQRAALQEAEALIASLQEEKQRIEPLVQADRQVVDAVLRLQEQRTAAATGRERWIGFAFGVGASLLASMIYAIAVYVYRKARRDRTGTSQQPSDRT